MADILLQTYYLYLKKCYRHKKLLEHEVTGCHFLERAVVCLLYEDSFIKRLTAFLTPPSRLCFLWRVFVWGCRWQVIPREVASVLVLIVVLIIHYSHKRYVTFVFQKHPCFFAVCGLVLEDPVSMISGVEGNVGIVGNISFKFAQHICSMALFNFFFLHSARHGKHELHRLMQFFWPTRFSLKTRFFLS